MVEQILDISAKKLIVRRFLESVKTGKDFDLPHYEDFLQKCKEAAIVAEQVFDEDAFILYYVFRSIFKLSKEQVLNFSSDEHAYDQLLILINKHDSFVDKQLAEAEVLYIFPEAKVLQ